MSLSFNMGHPQEGGVTLMAVSTGALNVVHLRYIQTSFKKNFICELSAVHAPRSWRSECVSHERPSGQQTTTSIILCLSFLTCKMGILIVSLSLDYNED